MKLSKVLTSILLFLFIFVSGCSLFVSLFVKNPEIKGIKKVGITEISLSEVEFLITLEIINENSFDADITNAQYKVYLNNEYLGNGVISKAQTINKDSISNINLPLRVKYTDLPSNIITLVKDVIKGNRIKYKVEGDADVEAEGFSVTVSIDVEKELTANKN
jgi:LEA14-like dessication related protein